MKTPGQIDVLFHSVLSRFFAIPARQRMSGNVTFAQMRILWILDFRKTASASDVARSAGISNSTATELVDRLVRGDYVRRAPVPADRRRVDLSLRPNGRRVLADFARRRRERIERLLEIVGGRDAERMAGALETLNEIIGKWPRR